MDAQKRSTGLVAVRSVAKMGVVVVHLWWLEGGAAQVKGLSNRQKTILSLHINRMDGQNSAYTQQEQIMTNLHILTGEMA